MNITKINDYDLWDSFVNNSPQGTLFHTSKWLSASGLDYNILGCFNKNGELMGGFVCGINLVRGKWTFYTHPSFTPYLGIIYADHKGKYFTKLSKNKQICHEFAKEIKKHCDIANLSMSAYKLDDFMPFIWENFSVSLRYTYVLQLNDIGEVWKNIDQKVRNSIKKAEKDGLWVDRKCNLVETLELMKKTFKRQNIELDPNYIKRAINYEKAMESYSQCKNFITKTKDGIPIAGVFIVYDGKRSYGIISGHDFESAHRSALTLAKWNAIEYTKNTLGLNEFDFEGTTLIHTEHRIREFGGTLIPYYTIKWTHPKLKPLFTAKKLIRDIYHAFKPQPLTGKIITD